MRTVYHRQRTVVLRLINTQDRTYKSVPLTWPRDHEVRPLLSVAPAFRQHCFAWVFTADIRDMGAYRGEHIQSRLNPPQKKLCLGLMILLVGPCVNGLLMMQDVKYYLQARAVPDLCVTADNASVLPWLFGVTILYRCYVCIACITVFLDLVRQARIMTNQSVTSYQAYGLSASWSHTNIAGFILPVVVIAMFPVLGIACSVSDKDACYHNASFAWYCSWVLGSWLTALGVALITGVYKVGRHTYSTFVGTKTYEEV